MTTRHAYLVPQPTLSSGRSGWVNIVGIRSAVAWLRRQVAIRRARRALWAMPDHILKDIGLTRSDIDYAVISGRNPVEGLERRR